MVEVAALVAGWMTPTSLFVLLNIVIATIFFISSFGFGSNQNNNKQPESTTAQSHPQLFRAPSLFSRVTSFNFSSTSTPQHHHHYSSYHSEPDETHFQPRPDPNPPAPSLISRVASFNFCRAQAQAQEEPAVAAEGKMGISSEEKVGDESRAVKREPEEEREKEKKKVVVKQRKVGGKKTKAAAATATTKTVSSEKSKTVSLEKKSTEGEVDAKADDFINRFKQQLKMQRLESLLRYRTPA